MSEKRPARRANRTVVGAIAFAVVALLGSSLVKSGGTIEPVREDHSETGEVSIPTLPESTGDVYYFPPQPDPRSSLLATQGASTTSTLPPRLETVTASELGLVLDPSGRPFNARPRSASPYNELLGTIMATDSVIVAREGYSLFAGEAMLDDDMTTTIDLAGARELAVTVLWQIADAPTEYPEYSNQVAGVRVDVPQRQVARWESGLDVFFNIASFTTAQEHAPDGTGDDGYLSEWKQHIHIGDHDERTGDDTVLAFGSENADYKLFIGYTDDDFVASVMAFDDYFPWRIAVLDGTPPSEITSREDELSECMNGVRPINHYGYCMPGDLAELIERLENPPEPEPSDPRRDLVDIIDLDRPRIIELD